MRIEGNHTGRLYCGTSNIELPVPNKSFFPPEFAGRSRLAYYASLFRTVEINRSFYTVPQRRTTERWASETPPEFRFTFKLWRGITHARDLLYDPGTVRPFLEAIDGVGEKRGCLLVQFPAGIGQRSLEAVRRLLGLLSEAGDWRLALEFRAADWYAEDAYAMLENYKASLVLHDMPGSATPLLDLPEAFRYYRFHGEKGDYKGSYGAEALETFARRMNGDRAAGRDVYAYFNNTIGDAVGDALLLRTLG